MKILSFFFFVTTIQLIASNSYSQDVNIKLPFKSGTVSEIFEAIENQTDYKIFYKSNQLDVTKYVSLMKSESTVSSILSETFKNSLLTYVLVDKVIVITPLENLQQQKVTGTIKDASTGEPIIGANIIIEGTTMGTVSDNEGNFSIDIPKEGPVLIVSFLGFNTERIIINGQSKIEVSLVPDITKLEEVVVIGYGTVKKSDLTGAVSQVSSEDINKRIVSRVDQAIAGTMSGVQVRQPNGQPGSSMVIRIRGIASINSNTEPLYVVDGLPTQDLNNLNANDIESIDVLKDASSAAIYGSRGSNGVVIITTKKGKSGQSKFELESYYGLQQVSKKVDLLNRDEYISLVTDARNNAYIDKYPTRSITDPNSARGNSAYYLDPNWTSPGLFPDTDWQDAIFRVAPVQNHQLSASGGSDKLNYFVSGNYFSQDGIVKSTGYERFSFRVNMDLKVNKRLKTGINLSPSYSIKTLSTPDFAGYNVVGKDGIIHRALIQAPILASDYDTYKDGLYQYGMVTPNPTKVLEKSYDRKNLMRILGSVYAEYEILKDLKYKISYSTNISADKTSAYYPKSIDILVTTATGYDATYSYRDWLLEHLLTYNKSFGKHSLAFMAGYSSQKFHQWTNNITGNNFPNDFVRTINAATTFLNQSSGESENSMISQFGRLNYSFGEKYLITTSLRRDGSSRFSQGKNKWGLFPSASVAWRISKEDWFKNVPVISDLKFRVSFGVTGNNNIGDYQYFPTMSGANYIFGAGDGAVINGLSLSRLENKNLSWETTKSNNYGFDLSLFKNRVSFTYNYYVNTTSDLFLNVPISALTGYTSDLQNYGKVENRGSEFDLLTRNISGSFNWSTTMNLSFNKNKVLKMGPTGAPIYQGGYGDYAITKVGSAIGSFYMYVADGIYQNQTEIDNGPTPWAGTKPGDVKLKDTNGDKIINSDDRIIVGKPNPDYYWGIRNDFEYKNFDLSFQLLGQNGSEIFNQMGRSIDIGGFGNSNQLSNWKNRWRSESEPGDGKTPRANASPTGAGGAGVPTTRWLYDASFWRLSNITFGYTMSKQMLDFLNIQRLRVYVMADNIYTHSSYPLYTPEASRFLSNTNIGADYGSYPLAKTYTIGINLTF